MDTGKQERKRVFGEGRHDSQDEFLCWQKAVGDISSLAFAIPAVLHRSDFPLPLSLFPHEDDRFSFQSFRMCPDIYFSDEDSLCCMCCSLYLETWCVWECVLGEGTWLSAEGNLIFTVFPLWMAKERLPGRRWPFISSHQIFTAHRMACLASRALFFFQDRFWTV